MRLLQKEIAVIRSTIAGGIPGAEVYIFGSKVRDDAKGGDIDILVIAQDDVPLGNILRVKIALKEHLGDQKIDLICQKAGALSPFGELMKLEGVQL